MEGRPGILVEDSKHALSFLAATFAGHPSRELPTIGITGTNGKTTIHWIVSKALTNLGIPNVRIGSLGIAADGRKVFPDHHCYSDRDQQELLCLMSDVQWAVTTEKDAVKLARFQWPKQVSPLFVRLEVCMEQEAAFWARFAAEKVLPSISKKEL